MLIKELDTLFIHIPKTGGSSVESLILEHLNLQSKLVYNRKCLNKYRKYYLDGRQHYGLGQFSSIKLNDLYIFSFVRNPYSRFYSSYLYSKRRFGSIMTLAEYVDFATRQKRYLFETDIKGHLIPQVRYIGRTDYFDCIGFMETFDEDFKKICSQIGINYKRKHLIKQEKPEGYLKELIPFLNTITDYYRDDFEMFGYTKYDLDNLKSTVKNKRKYKPNIDETISSTFQYSIYDKMIMHLKYYYSRMINIRLITDDISILSG